MIPLTPPPFTRASLSSEIASLLAEGYGVEDVAIRFRLRPREMPRLVREACRGRTELDPHIAIADRLAREDGRQ